MARLAWQSSLPQPSSRHLSISVCVLLSLSIHSTLFFCSATLLAICLCQGALSFVFSLTLDTPYDVPGLLSRGQHSPSCLAPREKVGRSTRRTTRTRRNQRRRLHLFQMSMLLFMSLLMMVAMRMEWLNEPSSDIQVLKTYGAAPYATALKKLEKQINETEGSVNEKIGVKVFSPAGVNRIRPHEIDLTCLGIRHRSCTTTPLGCCRRSPTYGRRAAASSVSLYKDYPR